MKKHKILHNTQTSTLFGDVKKYSISICVSTDYFFGRSLHCVAGGLSAISFYFAQRHGQNKKDAAAIPNAAARFLFSASAAET